MQRLRYGANFTNAIVPIKLFEEKVHFSETQLNQVDTTTYEQRMSNRSTMKILRLARTISGLDGDLFVSDQAINEALQWKTEANFVHTSLVHKGGRNQ